MDCLALQCVCGKHFSQQSGLSHHRRTCSRSKKQLSSALSKAKEVFNERQGRKKQRREENATNLNKPEVPALNVVSAVRYSYCQTNVCPKLLQQRSPSPISDSATPLLEGPNSSEPDHSDSNLSLAERRTRRQINLPKRYLDLIPQPPASLPPPPVQLLVSSTQLSECPGLTSSGPDNVGSAVIRQALSSPRNIFGLIRQYYGTCFPLHDPEELNTSDALSDIQSSCRPLPLSSLNVSPYPNHSSFVLGEWYWCGGVQKLKNDFKNLIKIITNQDFCPSDVINTKWDLIDQQLGSDHEMMWVDEDLDSSWERTPVTILVPFHRFTTHPGPREFTIPDFYHRSVVSILKEKLINDSDFQHFHLEPYELRWQPQYAGNSVRVHGELYNSSAFIEAHNELQNSPKEVGCNLPRIVVGLMFASDATHLTSFGDAKIWPLYLFFGNESKYRRGKPSLHLCNHVAYFLKVGNHPVGRCSI